MAYIEIKLPTLNRHLGFLFLLALLWTFGRLDVWTFAQSRQVPAPAQSKPIVIHGATIHPVNGPEIPNGWIRFEQGKITEVNSGKMNSSRDVERIDATGLHIYPGLISPNTYLGLTETGAVDVTNDHTELGRIKPEVRAASAINPDTDLIPVTRANGILTAMIFPRGGLISGRCSAIRMDGWTWEDMTIDADAGLVLNWPRTEPVVAWWMERNEEQQRREIRDDLEAIERFFDEAAAYVKAKDNDPALRTDLRYEGMRAALRGEKPIFVSAALSSQIESAVGWANRRGFKIVIVGGDQADRVTSLLKQYDIPVIVGGIHRLPSRAHDDYDQAFRLPAKLHEAGVRFCIATGGEAAHERNLNHQAGTAAAYGLPKDEAFKAVTLNAAQILGLGDRLGSLEAGKSATLIVTTGDPLELTTDTLMAFIDGRKIDLGSRHKALFEKYQQKYQQLGLIESKEAKTTKR